MMRILRAWTTAATAAAALSIASVAAAGGPVVGWGSNIYGAVTIPPSIDGTLGTATAIAAGGVDGCAIQARSGAVVCWGSNAYGQATAPPSVDGTNGSATAIAAGTRHSCAIQAGTGAVVCWGEHSSGEATPPASVDGTNGTATAIATGAYHSCAIQAGSGAVICWGWDFFDQVSPPPSVDGTLGSATAIEAGGTHSCAIQSVTAAVVCWGNNYKEGEFTGQATPPPSVDGTLGTATAIAALAEHTCAIQAGSGAAVCWGWNASGQATAPPSVDGTNGSAMAIATGYDHSCAIQAGSSAVVCWGADSWGKVAPPAQVDGTGGIASAIATGYDHSYAIRVPPLEHGDLVVTDHFGGRVVRIGADGAVATFSPPPGGTNLLVNPAGIVAAPDGDLYVVDSATDRLVRIDRRTGAQITVLEPSLDPFLSPTPINVGDQPFGIDFFEDDSGIIHLYVSASDGLHLASVQGLLLEETLPSSHFGVAARSDGLALDSVWIAAGPSGLWAWDASDGLASQALPPSANEWFLDVDFPDGALGLPIFTKVEEAGFGGCAAGTGGVFTAYEGVFALSQGDLLRCPWSLAFVPEQDEIYVTDASSLLLGGEGRVVKLRHSGDIWEQSLLVDAATLGVSLPAGIAYVPEPDSAPLGVVALAALATAARISSVSGRPRTGHEKRPASLP